MLATSPKTPRKPRCAFVDAALALDKLAQRLAQVLEFCRVPQHTGPFAPGPIIDLVVICGTINDGREWFGLSYRVMPPQVQRPMSTVDCPTLQSPRHDGFENGAQIAIDTPSRLPISHSLLQPQQTGPHRVGRKRNGGWFTAEHGQKSARSASASSCRSTRKLRSCGVAFHAIRPWEFTYRIA